MTNTNRGALKSLMLILLGIILGIVFTVGGVAGFGYYAYKNYKMGKVNEWTGKDIFGDATINGEEFKLYDMSVSEFMSFIQNLQSTSKNMSLNDIDALFPTFKISSLLSSFIKDGKFKITYEGGTIIEMDEKEFKSIPLKNMMSSMTTNLKTSMTLTSIESFNLGIDFSSFPFVKGEDKDGNAIYTYVSVGTGELADFYKDKTDQLYYVGSDGEYYQATPEMIERVTSVNFGRLNTAGEIVELFFRAKGLLELPLENAFEAITSSINFDKMTLSNIEEKFGLNLKQNDGSYNAIINKLKDKPFSSLANEMTDIVNELTLSDVMTNIEGTSLETLKFQRYSEQTAKEYNDGKPQSEWVRAGDYVRKDNGELVENSVAEIAQQIDCVKLKDFLKGYEQGENAVLDQVGELTISGIDGATINNIINDLTLKDVMGEIENDTVLYALQFMRYNEQTASEYNQAKPVSEHVAPGDKISDGAGGYVLVTVKDLNKNIDYIPIGEIIGSSDNVIVNSISEILIKNLGSEMNNVINSLSIDDVLGGIDDNGKLAAVKFLRYTDETAAAYNEGKPKSEWVYAGEYVLDEQNQKIFTKVNQLQEQLEYATLGDFIDEQQSTSQIMQSLKNVTIKNLGEKINNLTVEDVMGTSLTGMMESLAKRKYTAAEAEAYNVGKPSTQWVKEGDIVYEADTITPVKTKITELSGQIDYIRLSSVITVDTNSSEFLKKLMNSIGDSMLKDMDSALENVKIVDIMDVERDDVNQQVSGIWYFLLYDSTTQTVNEQITLKDMSTVFAKAAANISTSTIGTLVDKGILNISNLDEELRTYTLTKFLELINEKWSTIQPFL